MTPAQWTARPALVVRVSAFRQNLSPVLSILRLPVVWVGSAHAAGISAPGSDPSENRAQVSAPPSSLRHGFAWTIVGNVANGASQWAVLAAIAKLASPETLGEYALALAIATPVALFAHLNLRAMLATDIGGKHPFGDYARVRLAANGLAMTVLILIAFRSGLAVLVVGTSILVDNTSDLLFGFQQRRNRLDIVAQSMTIRSCVSVVLVIAFVYFWRSATAAAGGLLTGRMITFFAWDWPRSSLPPDARSDPRGLLRDALPLGLTQMLIALSTSLPRYAIERFGGTRELGVFAAAASFITVGSVVVNSLGQSAMTRLAEHRRKDRPSFYSLTRKMVAGIAGLGILAVACVWLLGSWVLSFLYTPEYAEYDELLMATLAAGSVGWISQILGFITTSARAFRAQLPLVAAVCFTAGVVSFAAVPAIGVFGAALALGIAGAVGIAGQILILRRAL